MFRRNRIDETVRRAVLTGVGQTSAEIGLTYADDMGCSLVETSAHVGARPEHATWQGQIFSLKGESKYPDFKSSTGYGTGAGLCGWNCRHSFYPYFEGLSSSAYPRSKLEEYNNKAVIYNGEEMSYYDATQKQRAYEKEIRAIKRELVGFDEAIKNGLQSAHSEFSSASTILKKREAHLKDFLQETKLRKEAVRVQTLGFGRGIAGRSTAQAEKNYQQWIKELNALNSAPKTLAMYNREKYNNTREFQLFKGYARAVENGDISPLIGLSKYKQISDDIQNSIVGKETSTGLVIESFTTHFIDRIIGQTEDSHTEKRRGVSISSALDALQSPIKVGNIRNFADGDVRQTFIGAYADVTVSIRDKRLIQTNTNRGEIKCCK